MKCIPVYALMRVNERTLASAGRSTQTVELVQNRRVHNTYSVRSLSLRPLLRVEPVPGTGQGSGRASSSCVSRKYSVSISIGMHARDAG